MKNILCLVLFLILVSCNTKQGEAFKWTEEEKDLTYQECIPYATDILEMNIDESDSYCQCTLNILITNFENNEDARIKIGKDKSFRSLFKSCEN